MNRRWLATCAACLAAVGIYGLTPSKAQEPDQSAVEAVAAPVLPEQEPDFQLPVDHSECTYFGPDRERFSPRVASDGGFTIGRLTRQYGAMAAGGASAGRSTPFATTLASKANLIDQYIWADLQAHGITPAQKTNDAEFIRRITLDLTGRIPTTQRLNLFVASVDPNKRAALVDELLASPAWVDKWTMYYGDLYKNTAANTQIQLRPEGRNAFYKWIHDSLSNHKPYDQMATELIAAQGLNSFDQTNGQINYLTLGVVGGGPAQDIFDQQAANIADTFLGLAHVNCILCHSGRGHLDSLSLWGSQATRTQAWGLAAFMARTQVKRLSLPVDPANPMAATVNYWSLDKYTTDYALNTTTGNRPARQPVGALKLVTPNYFFSNQIPPAGTEYRAALAKYVTGDFQFARATVNYLWAQFFGAGIVDPPDQFDPARLDPNTPPAAPWTLQPSNPALLNALAQWFIDNHYDVRAFMRLIATSDTYQLASDYSGTWDPAWDKYFGRKFVRRLWPEEIHDSIVTAVNTLPSYTVPGFTADSTVFGANSPGFGKISFAMQAPDVVNMPDGGGAVSQFLDSFLRGNRDDQPRKGEGTILQALNLMNDNFVESRIHATGSGATATYLTTVLAQPGLTNDQLVTILYQAVLSRNPSPTELATANTLLQTGGTIQRKTNAEDLLWTLFNKVDFVFNY